MALGHPWAREELHQNDKLPLPLPLTPLARRLLHVLHFILGGSGDSESWLRFAVESQAVSSLGKRAELKDKWHSLASLPSSASILLWEVFPSSPPRPAPSLDALPLLEPPQPVPFVPIPASEEGSGMHPLFPISLGKLCGQELLSPLSDQPLPDSVFLGTRLQPGHRTPSAGRAVSLGVRVGGI